MDEDVSVPGLAACPMERIVLLAEFRRHMRRREQPSIQVVRPRVVGALDAAGEMTFRLLAQPCAAVTTDVEQRLDLARSIARDDHAVVPKRAREVIAGVGNLIGASGAEPAVDVEALQLRAVEIRIGVEAPRQCRVHPGGSAEAFALCQGGYARLKPSRSIDPFSWSAKALAERS